MDGMRSLSSDAAHGVGGDLQTGDWPTYGGDAGAMKYSPVTDIDRGNVANLVEAWSWDTGDEPISGPRLPVTGQRVRPGNFQTTPVVLNDTMYLSTPYNRVVALDADSGSEIWSYDPHTTEWGQPPNGTGFVHRGVAVWTGSGERRVFINSRWRLIALDSRTGEPIESFGRDGEIDLTEHLIWRTNPLHYTQTSPPVIYDDLIILGNGVWDGFVYERDPPGSIQAFDVHTGELVWSFGLIPQAGEFGNDTWEDDSWNRVGHSNAWAPLSVDLERGLVFVPVGTPSNDYYGGDRLGDNLFAESLVALDARTGERVWHFQAVRHGLWDYDLPAQPTLLTITVDGREIDAVAASSKMGFLFVFDRATGEPVWPIEDRPVIQSDVPGERTSPTQPFPTKPPAFAPQGFTEDDLVDFTPALRAEALQVVRPYRTGPLYLPPSLQGSFAQPGIIGGGNWGGTAVDPETSLLYVKSTNSPAVLALGAVDTTRTEGRLGIDRTRRSIRLASGIPIQKPPYGTLTAIDMNRGEIAWQIPIGDTPQVRENPALAGVALPDRLGVTGAPGPIVTAGGLVFLTGGGDVLYGIDKTTGEELWSADLGQVGYANPMTYRTRAGRQFVVIATGAGAGTRLVAFALPES
jgi:quinoprotein glucose dehydrogenase